MIGAAAMVDTAGRGRIAYPTLAARRGKSAPTPPPAVGAHAHECAFLLSGEDPGLSDSVHLALTHRRDDEPACPRRHRRPAAQFPAPTRLRELSERRRYPSDLKIFGCDANLDHRSISSVTTVNCTSLLGPKLVEIATSVASRPRAMRIRQMRGVLCRASKVYHCPSR
jgi:hypothetical protein